MKKPMLCRLGLHAWITAYRVLHVPRLTIPIRYCPRCKAKK